MNSGFAYSSMHSVLALLASHILTWCQMIIYNVVGSLVLRLWPRLWVCWACILQLLVINHLILPLAPLSLLMLWRLKDVLHVLWAAPYNSLLSYDGYDGTSLFNAPFAKNFFALWIHGSSLFIELSRTLQPHVCRYACY